MCRYLDGVQKENATAARDGLTRVDNAKRYLKCEEYRQMARASLERWRIQGSKPRHATELHLFITMGWALCARNDTTSHMHVRHLKWDADALLVGVPKSKRNYIKGQMFRVYANPFDAVVCPVLALAMHLACNPQILSTGAHGEPLFQSKAAGRTVCGQFNLLARELGLEAGLGTHSVRKGGITYASTGTPEFCPLIAIVQRARWNTSVRCSTALTLLSAQLCELLTKRLVVLQALSVVLKYAKLEASGDAVVGRLLALLNPQTHEFGALPPHFTSLSEAEQLQLSRVLGGVFAYGGIRHEDSIQLVLSYLFATLLWHEKALRELLPQTHPLWGSAFGTLSVETRAQWFSKVTIEPDESLTALDRKGVPVAIHMLESVNALGNDMKQLYDRVNALSAGVDRIADVLPQSAAGIQLNAQRRYVNEWMGEVRHGLLGVMKDFLEESKGHFFAGHSGRRGAAASSSTPAGTVLVSERG